MIDRYSTPELAAIWSEENRYRLWAKVELATMRAFEQLGEIPQGSAQAIEDALANRPIDAEFVQRVAEIEAVTRHDIVAFTRAISEHLPGVDTRYLHYGLTSTDVVDTAQSLALYEATQVIIDAMLDLSEVLSHMAQKYQTTPTIGRTHGIHAEPTTFGLKLANFHAALLRDIRRISTARDHVCVVMLSGSVGTYAHIDPRVERLVAQELELDADAITNQTIARDRHAEFMSALAIYGTTIERIAVEIRHLQRSEVREVQEGFAKGQTGSSSMPHKKNPIATENLTGVARVLRGNAQIALENVVLWHERDISHSSAERIILPDSTILVHYATKRLTNVLKNLVVDAKRMKANIDALNGLVFSQRVLHQLIAAGIHRDEAYHIVQDASLECWNTGTHLRTLIEADERATLTGEQLDEAFDLHWFLRHAEEIFERLITSTPNPTTAVQPHEVSRWFSDTSRRMES